MDKYIIAITGATGSIFAIDLIKKMTEQNVFIYVLASSQAQKVIEYETNNTLDNHLSTIDNNNYTLESNDNFFSPIASGSNNIKAMVVLPCSMGTLGRISAGTSDSLIIRSADVMLKERKKLILAVRETPLNSIHIANMLTVSNAGGIIMPLCPLFYTKPQSTHDIVNDINHKIMRTLGIFCDDMKLWDDNDE